MSDQDRGEKEDPDHETVSDKLMAEHSLQEKSQQSEHEDMGKGDEVELLEVLDQFVMVVPGQGLTEEATEQDDGEQEEFNEREGTEPGEPVGRLPHGQR